PPLLANPAEARLLEVAFPTYLSSQSADRTLGVRLDQQAQAGLYGGLFVAVPLLRMASCINRSSMSILVRKVFSPMCKDTTFMCIGQERAILELFPFAFHTP